MPPRPPPLVSSHLFAPHFTSLLRGHVNVPLLEYPCHTSAPDLPTFAARFAGRVARVSDVFMHSDALPGDGDESGFFDLSIILSRFVLLLFAL